PTHALRYFEGHRATGVSTSRRLDKCSETPTGRFGAGSGRDLTRSDPSSEYSGESGCSRRNNIRHRGRLELRVHCSDLLGKRNAPPACRGFVPIASWLG